MMKQISNRGLFHQRAVWTSAFTIASLIALLGVSAADGQSPVPKKTIRDAGSTLKIVKEDLFERNNFYLIKGSIYNPNARAIKNIVIRYYVWKKFTGHADRGSIVSEGGGLVQARIKYLPPKQAVEFTTDDGAPVYRDVQPDPLKAEISGEWDQ